MSWNYRVGKKIENGEEVFSFVEAYYDENKAVVGMTDFVDISAYSVTGLKWVVSKLQEALDKDVIDIEDLNVQCFKSHSERECCNP